MGVAMVRVLEKLGHTLVYPERQTCCGQPPFNSGFSDEARAVAAHQLTCFEKAEVVVGPSGSCVAMIKVFYPQLFAGTPQEAAAQALADKTFEFSQFLVDRLGITDVGATFQGKVTIHDGCHGLRELRIKRQPR